MNRSPVGAGAESESIACAGPSNGAWAKADIPLSPPEAFLFLLDVERLFRLNPHLDIAEWRQEPGQACYRLSAFNDSNGCHGSTAIRAEARENRGITLRYDAGIKASTEFSIAPSPGGSSLTITENYHPIEGRDAARLGEVDRSLLPWLAAIRAHLRGRARYRRLPGYRWWGRFMLGMPPRQRRIVRLIVWASVLEFIVFLFVAAIFWLEWPGG